MPEEKKEEIQNNEEEQKTSVQENLTEEENNKGQEEDTSQNNEGAEEEEVKISKAEFEKIQKKARDFDGIIEKKRIEKLKNREAQKGEEGEKSQELDQEKLDAIIEAKVSEKLNLRNKEEYESNLTAAYKDFVAANPWADNDDVIASISKDFSGQGAVSKSDLLLRIGQAAERNFPTEYEKARTSRIRAQVLAGEESIDAGDTGGGNSRPQGFEAKKQLTEAQLEVCRKSGNKPEDVYPEYFK